MKIRPVILCGGAGTRLWPDKKKHQAKQFIDFGGWSLIQKTLERVNKPIFDFPIISTNLKYLKQVKLALKKSKIKKFKIVLEPAKKNTAPAILASALIKDIPFEQPLMFFAADHLIERSNILNKSLLKNKSNLDNQNLFIFGIKPTNPSSEYGYFVTKKIKSINKVTKFIEKPKLSKAKEVITTKELSKSEIASGLKEALVVGVSNSSELASEEGGFNNNNLIRIPFPSEAEKMKSTLINVGLNLQVKQFEESLNSAAEEASKFAKEIFIIDVLIRSSYLTVISSG